MENNLNLLDTQKYITSIDNFEIKQQIQLEDFLSIDQEKLKRIDEHNLFIEKYNLDIQQKNKVSIENFISSLKNTFNSLRKLNQEPIEDFLEKTYNDLMFLYIHSISKKPKIYEVKYNDKILDCSKVRSLSSVHAKSLKFKEEQDELQKPSKEMIDIANKHNIDIIDLNREKAFKKINNVMADLWFDENYKENEFVEYPLCECNEWKVGDNRCSCTDRKVYYDILGNYETGFSIYFY